MAEEIQVVLDELNARLSGKLPYKLYLAQASEIDFLDKNARYMTKEQFESLTRNIKTDGGLTSIPLCYRQENGRLLVLSGNHRLKAAIEAGVRENLVLLIDKPLSKQRQLAIQLSHNAIEGQDDEQILKELYLEIDELEASIYSGLSTELVEKLTSIDFTTISEQRPLFKEISLLFLPEEIESMTAICDGIIETAKSKIAFTGRITEYDDILEGIIAAKQGQKIINSTVAFFAMARVVSGNIWPARSSPCRKRWKKASKTPLCSSLALRAKESARKPPRSSAKLSRKKQTRALTWTRRSCR